MSHDYGMVGRIAAQRFKLHPRCLLTVRERNQKRKHSVIMTQQYNAAKG